MIVLIVDNSLTALKEMEAQIQGMAEIDEVILCSDSVLAMGIVRQRNVDIIIMDVVMSGMGGLELLKEVRKDASMDGVQVIMLTTEAEYMRESFNCGADDFIRKPIEPVELQSRIKALVKTRKNFMLVGEMNRQLFLKNQELVKLNELLNGTQLNIIQNEKMASIGELAAGVAHEINNPLGFVKSNIETLNSFLKKLMTVIGVYRMGRDGLMCSPDGSCVGYIRNVTEAEKKYKLDFIIAELEPLFDDLQEGITRVTKIVSTLTSFAHTSMDGEHVLNSVNSIIEESLLIIRNEYKYTIDIQTQLDSNDEICCNKGQLEQVLINVLMNAIHAIKSMQRAEKGTIVIQTQRKKDWFQIVISDDGPGVPEELFNRIFDPFFTTKDIGKGTGLGLSISYDIVVNKHKGRISVANGQPSGAVFEIELPIKVDHKQQAGGEE
jgi:signal transduction histidine kinase